MEELSISLSSCLVLICVIGVIEWLIFIYLRNGLKIAQNLTLYGGITLILTEISLLTFSVDFNLENHLLSMLLFYIPLPFVFLILYLQHSYHKNLSHKIQLLKISYIFGHISLDSFKEFYTIYQRGKVPTPQELEDIKSKKEGVDLITKMDPKEAHDIFESIVTNSPSRHNEAYKGISNETFVSCFLFVTYNMFLKEKEDEFLRGLLPMEDDNIYLHRFALIYGNWALNELLKKRGGHV